MKQLHHVLFILLVGMSVSSCKTTKYSDVGTDTYTIEDFEVYTSLAGVSSVVQKELRTKGIKRIVLVNGGHIEKGLNFDLPKQELFDYLYKYVPDEDSDAMIVLDLEGEKMIELNRTTDQQMIDKIINSYIAIYDFVKSQRPNATIGYYGYPFRDYWNRNDEWRARNERLLPLFARVDALFPSVYDFYVDGKDVKAASDRAYVIENVEESLRLAADFDIPVYPFIWHRYHDSNKEKALQFIDEDEFADHVEAIAAAEYNGGRAAGLVWWSSEKYYFNREKQKGMLRTRSSTSQSFEDYSTRNSLRYINSIERGIKKARSPAQE